MILNFLLFVERFLLIQRELYFLFCPKGAGFCPTYRGDAGQRGYSLSKENAPFGTPRERRGVFPSTPDIAGLELEELHTLRIAQPLAALLPYGCGIPLAGNRVRCTWLRHESSASRNYSQPRLTIVRRE